jgi:hypothetical protein
MANSPKSKDDGTTPDVPEFLILIILAINYP